MTGSKPDHCHHAAVLHECTVPAEAAGSRLDVWLETQLDGCSRSLVSRLMKQGLCAVHDAAGQSMRVKAGLALRGGEQVAIEVPEIEAPDLEPEDIPLSILHEDEHLIVVDKPAGMVVHPAVGRYRGTLVNALLGRYGLAPNGDAWRPGIVHRLDEDTSGVIVVARTTQALTFLQDAFRERVVQKRYLAVVHGSPKADFFEHHGWLGRHPKDFRKRAVLPEGTRDAKEAYTSFHVRLRYDGYAVVEARPRTGRTHQIRVHLTALRHPLLADRVYGRSDRWPLGAAAGVGLHRHALHAWALDIPHPSGGRLRMQAPIPADLAPLIHDPLQPLPFS